MCTLDTFAYNPQFGMTLSNPDPEDADGLCTIIIAVLQKNRRELKPQGIDNLAIGFAVYEVQCLLHSILLEIRHMSETVITFISR